jgi:hypothetical protein
MNYLRPKTELALLWAPLLVVMWFLNPGNIGQNLKTFHAWQLVLLALLGCMQVAVACIILFQPAPFAKWFTQDAFPFAKGQFLRSIFVLIFGCMYVYFAWVGFFDLS